ncbi:NAD(P)-dependent oxidoreductase [Agrobacterium tumefaciens]|jgi:3-hydroxyisobutyrate dehydrogenase-like beta-hydroxyacid dehydrogenase|uniref:NAD(P)-dependent oxidoreductase n=1 Tax=Agrobacterium tumefaciens TaxID=358 RepID=UPI00234FE301
MSVKVGFIGAGAMGEPMALRLARNKFDLIVCDVSEKALSPFGELGVRTTQNPADCGNCDVIMLMVANYDQIRQVVLGPSGIVTNKPKDKTQYLIVMGTVLPAAIREFANEVEQYGIKLIDSPVSGGVVKAVEGTLTIILGGDRADCDAVKDVLSVVGEQFFYCGPVGSAQITKIVNNVVCIANMMISAEAYRIGLDNGLSLKDMIPVMEAGTGRNFFTENVEDAPKAYGAWAPTRKDFDSIQSIIHKDIGLGLKIGSGSGKLPMTEALYDVLSNVGDDSFKTWRRVIETLESPRKG